MRYGNDRVCVIAVILALTALNSAQVCAQERSVDMVLTVRPVQTLPLIPPQLRIDVWNRFGLPVDLPTQLRMYVRPIGGDVLPRPRRVLSIPDDYIDLALLSEVRTLAPDERLTMVIEVENLVSAQWFLRHGILDRPGEFELHVELADSPASDVDGGLRRVIRSNAARLTISAPAGEDAKALEAIRREFGEEPRWLHAEPWLHAARVIVADHADSAYAALAVPLAISTELADEVVTLESALQRYPRALNRHRLRLLLATAYDLRARRNKKDRATALEDLAAGARLLALEMKDAESELLRDEAEQALRSMGRWCEDASLRRSAGIPPSVD